MSRWTFPQKAGIVMTVAAFVIGITAATALGWGSGGQENEKPPTSTPKHEGNKDNDKNEEEHGKGEKPKPKPPETTAPAGQPAQPAPAATPPAVTPPTPVVSQGVPAPPATPEQPTGTKSAPPQSPVVAQASPGGSVPTTPVANRKQLAKTGLDPALIALLGALCLGGGGLLFRRALARS